MTTIQSSGIEPGERRLNGPQTTGRNYRNLLQPAYGMTRDDDVAVLMRDGIVLLADVHRPTEPGRYPALLAASPYPRQIQNLGAPAGFIEAGASDFFVPRGYVHVIANCRGHHLFPPESPESAELTDAGVSFRWAAALPSQPAPMKIVS